MLTIILCWLLLFAIIYSIGLTFIKNGHWYQSFWVGLVVVFGLLQVWSLFLPISRITFIAISILSILSVIVNRKNIKIPKFDRRIVIPAVIVIVFVSYYASQPVGWDDTLLYHLNAVKWGKEYAVVPGLANLHSRLGFNSSFFLFASLLDNWMVDRSSHIALSFISIVLSMQYLWILLYSKVRSIKLYCLLTMPLIIYSIANREIIASLSPDFALTILVLATSIEFISNKNESRITVVLLSLLLMTVKFSAVVFCAFILIFTLFKRRDYIKYTLLPAFLIIGPYLARNFYLSGWLLYPLPYFKFNVDWAVPRGLVEGVYTVITTWAKAPGPKWVNYINASFWDWFPVWYQSNQHSFEIKIFIFGILLFLSMFIYGKITKTIVSVNNNLIILSLISLVSVTYIFFTAPDIRFGEVFMWVFFATIVSTYLMVLNWNDNIKFLTMFGVIIFCLFVSWPFRFDNKPILKSVRWDQAWPTTAVDGILHPLEQNFCGNSALPCTPEEAKIKWREPGNLSKGFSYAN